MQKTIFKIIKMDCPSEEQLIRMKLQKFDEIKSLEFDIANRKLTVHHIAESQPILSALETLNLDTTLISTEENTIEIEAGTAVCNENYCGRFLLSISCSSGWKCCLAFFPIQWDW